MTDRPILFSAPMGQAILREIAAPGTGKTQTRRLLKPQPPHSITRLIGPATYHPVEVDRRGDEVPGRPVWGIYDEGGEYGARIGFKPGQRLWVREAWRVWWEYNDCPPSQIPTGASIQYMADEPLSPWDTRGRASMHMPRWASRITLIVTDVRVQRLQDISEEDAIAEGIEWREGCWGTWNADGTMRCGGSGDPREAFRCLWININGPESWQANPWIAAIAFRPILANIDQVPHD